MGSGTKRVGGRVVAKRMLLKKWQGKGGEGEGRESLAEKLYGSLFANSKGGVGRKQGREKAKLFDPLSCAQKSVNGCGGRRGKGKRRKRKINQGPSLAIASAKQARPAVFSTRPRRMTRWQKERQFLLPLSPLLAKSIIRHPRSLFARFSWPPLGRRVTPSTSQGKESLFAPFSPPTSKIGWIRFPLRKFHLPWRRGRGNKK